LNNSSFHQVAAIFLDPGSPFMETGARDMSCPGSFSDFIEHSTFLEG
jgi:hypothetical protein